MSGAIHLDESVEQDVSLSWYDSLVPTMCDGHEVRLLTCGRDFFPRLVQAIEQARQSVSLETYIFNDDRSGRQVAQALADARARGVSVRCVADGFGTQRLTGKVA